MRTITFYAYKGGTGRTLALANAAKYIARLGQKVFAIDLDLEAPGLHHKLLLSTKDSPTQITHGIVDCIYAFTKEGRFPATLAPYTVNVPPEENRDGQIILMPAGNVVAGTYWRRLTELNWHDLFYKAGGDGLLFFLELKERIKAEFRPDFLLIDARTGITEIGGVATTILPDQVVCLLLNNRENLEGAREVIRGINRVADERKKTIGIVPVLSRLPGTSRRLEVDFEKRVSDSVYKFLCEPADDSEAPLALPGLSILHAEESLAYQEALRIGSTKTVDESPLLRDYLRLFTQIIPNEQVEPHLDHLVANAMNDMLDKPDRAQSDLEALAIYCPHPTSYLALLKFYRLRNAAASKMLQTAVRFWELSRRSDHPLLLETVREYFKPERSPRDEAIPSLGEFVEAVWNAGGGADSGIGLKLVDQLLMQRHKDKAVGLIQQIVTGEEVTPSVVVGCVKRLVEAEEYLLAKELVERWIGTLADNSEFQSAWATIVVRQNDAVEAKGLFESKDFRPAILLAKQPQIYIRLLTLAGRKEELDAALESSLVQSLASMDTDQILQTAAIFEEMGRVDHFMSRVKKVLPPNRVERILAMLPNRRGMSVKRIS